MYRDSEADLAHRRERIRRKRAIPEYKEQERQYRQRPEVKEATREYQRHYRQKNKEYVAARSRRSYLDRVARIESSPESFLEYLFVRTKRSKWYGHDGITFDQLLALHNDQDGRCNLCGVLMEYKFKSLRSISIDRIDSTIGYTPGNTQLVCLFINLGKQKFNQDDVALFLEDIISGS